MLAMLAAQFLGFSSSSDIAGRSGVHGECIASTANLRRITIAHHVARRLSQLGASYQLIATEALASILSPRE